jgi:hypothetical protein
MLTSTGVSSAPFDHCEPQLWRLGSSSGKLKDPFSGAVLIHDQALVDAHLEQQTYPYMYDSTIGLIFFGTPFRGTDKTTIATIVELATQKFGEDQVLKTALRTSEGDDEALTSLVERYHRTARGSIKPKVACFFEQRPTNVARIVNKEVREFLSIITLLTSVENPHHVLG